jgi:phosphoserine phosphatase
MLEQHIVRKFGFPRKLMQSLRATHYLLAISASPDILVEPFVQDLGVEASYGSRFEVQDGRFTGQADSVGDKAAILRRLVDESVAIQAGSVAMGDTFGDIPMLEYAANPVMFNASKTLTNYGSEFGWIRVNEVKDQITALQWNGDAGLYVECSPDDVINRLKAA